MKQGSDVEGATKEEHEVGDGLVNDVDAERTLSKQTLTSRRTCPYPYHDVRCHADYPYHQDNR